MTTTANLPAQGCGSNYPMALDERTSRLFIGCRQPAQLALVDNVPALSLLQRASSGIQRPVLRRQSSRIYVIGGEGYVDIIAGGRSSAARRTRHYADGRADWALGAGPASTVLAVPARGGQPAEVRVFELRRSA
jgi:hypothetical protein